MKLVKNFVFAVLLVSVIAVNTPAGEQETPGYAAPPPRVMSTADEDTTVSMTEPDGGVTAETSDYLIYEAFEALLSVY
jgi:hypothetical protein